MAVTKQELREAQGRYPGNLLPVGSNAFGEITAIMFKTKGIIGGVERSTKKLRIPYKLIIDVENITSSDIPDVWILDPKDEFIKHRNIYHPRLCPKMRAEYPMFCWGTYVNEWRKLARSKRTLMALLQFVKQHLGKDSGESPAR